MTMGVKQEVLGETLKLLGNIIDEVGLQEALVQISKLMSTDGALL